MKIEINDYVLVQERNADSDKITSSVIKVEAVKADSVKGLLENLPHLNPTHVEVPKHSVKLNLGNSPPQGTAYGVDLSSRYLGKKYHEDFGDVHFFTKPQKELGEALMENMTKVASKLRKESLIGILDLPFTVEVHKPTGKYAGWFRPSKDPEVTPHRVAYSCLSADPVVVRYVLLHELGHLCDKHILSKHKEHWAKWIRLYCSSVEPVSLSIHDSKQLLKDLFQAASEEQSLKQWLSGMEVEDRRKANLTLAWVKKVHSLSVAELDCLMGSQEEQRISDLWPRDVITVKGTVPLVTEYATKSVAELFAESFAYHLCDRDLPKSVNKLIEKSVSIIKSELN